MDNTATYPNNWVDPREKGYDYILQYCRAAYKDGLGYMPAFMSNLSLSRYAEIREYALGKQSITKYKKVQPGDDLDDNSGLSIDWSPLAVLPKFREIAISKILQQNYDIQCYAIDPLSKSEEDAFFNQMKIKIMMRMAAQQIGSHLQNNPALQSSPNEPQDLEELQMQMEYGYKHIMCMEAEEAIQLVMMQNGWQQEDKRMVENYYDYGIAFFKDWIDENGKERFRAVDIQNFMCSFCIKPDFSDMIHAGEFLEVPMEDLAPYFSPEQMIYIAQNVAGKYGNPSQFFPTGTRWWNRFKVRVWDFEFLDWDTYVYGSEIDGRENLRYGKVDYANLSKIANDSQGEQEPVYQKITKKVLRKCKWIVDSNLMYDWGISENQYRRQSSWWDTKLNYTGYAWNFNRMYFTGITERLMPIADAMQLTWLKLQNMKNKLIPYKIDIDLNALEDVAIGGGGAKMTPDEIIDFLFNNFILLYRSDPIVREKNPNYNPVRIEASGQLTAFAQLYQDLQVQMDLMRQISGLNELTDGSTPNAKTLVPVADAAVQSTNNALYLISQARRMLTERLADQIFCKVQIALKLGKVEGYVKPLGMQTVKFLQINPDLSLREMGIYVEEAITETQREMLYQELNMKESQGIIRPQDKIIVMSCRNMKQAQIYLAYVTNKRMQENQQFELQKIQQQSQTNAQVAASVEQMKQQTAILQAKLDIEVENVKGQWQYIIETAKKASDQDEARIQGQAKVLSASIMANAKQAAQSIAS